MTVENTTSGVPEDLGFGISNWAVSWALVPGIYDVVLEQSQAAYLEPLSPGIEN